VLLRSCLGQARDHRFVLAAYLLELRLLDCLRGGQVGQPPLFCGRQRVCTLLREPHLCCFHQASDFGHRALHGTLFRELCRSESRGVRLGLGLECLSVLARRNVECGLPFGIGSHPYGRDGAVFVSRGTLQGACDGRPGSRLRLYPRGGQPVAKLPFCLVQAPPHGDPAAPDG